MPIPYRLYPQAAQKHEPLRRSRPLPVHGTAPQAPARLQRGTPAHRSLLNLQQTIGNQGVARLLVRRQPLPLPPVRRFAEVWPEFERARFDLRRDAATALAKELAGAPHTTDDILNHGIDVVAWLQNNGESGPAAQLLDTVQSAWMVQFVSENKTLPIREMLVFNTSDPSTLITLGREAARAGKHDQAFRFFGVANQILSYYALDLSAHRTAQMEQENDEENSAGQGDPARQQAIRAARFLPGMIARGQQYSNLQAIYTAMSEIYSFYGVLEEEATAAGDAQKAAAARAKAAELRQEIKAKYSWGETQAPGSITQQVRDPVEIAEVSYTDTPKGPGLTLHGANGAETDLTQLPGLPAPKEIGNNVQVQNLGALQDALMNQADFTAEVRREPKVRAAFGGQQIDFNNTKQRQKVWQIMYGVYQAGGTGALGALMALIGRYLKAFTIHTSYNVRDWGKNYLDSEMPTDLAGRAEKDCGVYALTVAWDVYQAVRGGGMRTEVAFDLYTMLEHVTLVITDKGTNEFYVVNNDTISPPQRGDPLDQVAPQYGALRGLKHTAGPAMQVSLGSTKTPAKRFHDEAWTKYQAATDWGLHLAIPPEVARLERSDPARYAQAVLAIQKARYEAFYRDQEIFDRDAQALDAAVDGLAGAARDGARLATALPPIVESAGALAVLFHKLGPAPGIDAGSTRAQAMLQGGSRYLFTNAPGHSVHPLARVARAILHLQALGGTLTQKEDALVQFCRRVPQFRVQLDQYTQAGAMGPF